VFGLYPVGGCEMGFCFLACDMRWAFAYQRVTCIELCHKGRTWEFAFQLVTCIELCHKGKHASCCKH